MLFQVGQLLPLAFMAEQVGGEYVSVTTIVILRRGAA